MTQDVTEQIVKPCPCPQHDKQTNEQDIYLSVFSHDNCRYDAYTQLTWQFRHAAHRDLYIIFEPPLFESINTDLEMVLIGFIP